MFYSYPGHLISDKMTDGTMYLGFFIICQVTVKLHVLTYQSSYYSSVLVIIFELVCDKPSIPLIRAGLHRVPSPNCLSC